MKYIVPDPAEQDRKYYNHFIVSDPIERIILNTYYDIGEDFNEGYTIEYEHVVYTVVKKDVLFFREIKISFIYLKRK